MSLRERKRDVCDEDRENYIYKEKRRGGKSQKAERELAHRGWSGEREADKVGEGERWNSGGERERWRRRREAPVEEALYTAGSSLGCQFLGCTRLHECLPLPR